MFKQINTSDSASAEEAFEFSLKTEILTQNVVVNKTAAEPRLHIDAKVVFRQNGDAMTILHAIGPLPFLRGTHSQLVLVECLRQLQVECIIQKSQ